MSYYKYLVLLGVSINLLSATVYEDGESLNTKQWSIYDSEPSGAKVKNIFDKVSQSRVIEFKGAGRKNSYIIGSRGGIGAWRNSKEKILSWSMKFSEKFKLVVYLTTENGHRTIYYNYRDNDKGLFNEKYILMGLGVESKSGKWINFKRNLDEDLEKYDKGNRIMFVNGFRVQGSGKIDNIKLTRSIVQPLAFSNAKLLRGPYLQQGSSSSILIKWRTDVATDSRITYGKSYNNQDLVEIDATLTKDHEVKLKNLSASQRYFYKIGDSKEILKGDKETFFKTSPKTASSEPVRVWVLGDSGATSKESKEVYTAYQKFSKNKETDLVLMLGDNAYKNGTDKEIQASIFDKYTDILGKASLWSVYGNHDARTPKAYFNTFTFPKNAELGGVASHTENYYSYDYGNIHFVVLDSSESDVSTPSSKMLKWFKEDLKNNHSKWTIAAWHHPPYSKGSYDTDKQHKLINIRKNILPIIEEYGVDLVLTGHSHVYERSKFIHGHYGKSSTLNLTHIVQNGDGDINGDGAYIKKSKKGTVYLVLGSSGSFKKGVVLNHPVMASDSKGTLGSVIIDTTENFMDVKYLTNKEVIFDSFRIQK